MQQTEIHPKMYMYRRVVEAKIFMDRHYAKAIDLDKIADQAAFSKYHFLRLFKNTFGMSPHQYLISVRVNAAKKLLLTKMTISDVCFAVGFESVPSFTRLFKQKIGISPGLFVKTELSKVKNQVEEPKKYVPGCFAINLGMAE